MLAVWSIQLLFICIIMVLASFPVNQCLGADVEGKIVIPNNEREAANQRVVLNGGEFRTISHGSGHFKFFDVPAGIYSCDVYSAKYHFPSFKIKVSEENSTISVVEYKYVGAKRLSVNYPLTITALVPIQYEMVKPPFSIMGMIMANPMMLLMLFSFVMVFAMPKMMQGMTPEELEQIQKNSAMSGGDPMKNFSKLMGVPSSAGDDEDD